MGWIWYVIRIIVMVDMYVRCLERDGIVDMMRYQLFEL
jgi:hypothetical protein